MTPDSRATLASTLSRLRCARGVVSRLQDASIDVVLLKGIALVDVVYSPEERAMSDVDLLVRPGDFESAHRVMIGGLDASPSARPACAPRDSACGPALGRSTAVPRGHAQSGGSLSPFRMYEMAGRPYTTWHFHQRAYFGEGGCSVDLHCHFDEPGRWRIDDEGLFLRAVPHVLDGVKTLRLSDEDTLLHLAIHLTKEELGSVTQSLRDIDRIIERRPIDWDVLAERARAWGAVGVTWLALRLVRNLYGARVPNDVLRELAPSLARRAYFHAWLDFTREPPFRFPAWRRRRQVALRSALLDTWSQRTHDVAGVAKFRLGDALEKLRAK